MRKEKFGTEKQRPPEVIEMKSGEIARLLKEINDNIKSLAASTRDIRKTMTGIMEELETANEERKEELKQIYKDFRQLLGELENERRGYEDMKDIIKQGGSVSRIMG